MIRMLVISAVLIVSIVFVRTLLPTTLHEKNPFIELTVDADLISHAGGGLIEGKYSNSLEALNRAADDGFTYFEVDLYWTFDDQIILFHGSNRAYGKLFAPPLSERIRRIWHGQYEPLSHSAFMNKTLKAGLTQLDLTGLMTWLQSHPKAIIVTDVKRENMAALELISTRYPEFRAQIAPQIYAFSNYAAVRDMGYTDIIFTSYRNSAPISEIIEFDRQNSLLAVTLPSARLTADVLSQLSELSAPLWTHTINSPKDVLRLTAGGVDGFYTDYLLPKVETVPRP